MVILEYNLLTYVPCKGRIILTKHWQFLTVLPGCCQRKGVFVEFPNVELHGGGISVKWLGGACWLLFFFFFPPLCATVCM